MEISGGGNTGILFMGDVGGSPNPAQFIIGRFVAEARLMALVVHPNVMPVFDAGRLGDGRPQGRGALRGEQPAAPVRAR